MEVIAIQPEKTLADYVAENVALHRQLDALRLTFGLLEEKVRYLLQQRFGAKAERIDPHQLPLFDAPAPIEAEPVETPVVVAEHTRVKGGRRRPPAHLERREELIELPEGACGAVKQVIGEERSERYEMEPAKVWVSVQVRPIYACSCCDVAPVTAPAPPAPHPGLRQPARPCRHQQVRRCPAAAPPSRHPHPPFRRALHLHDPGGLDDPVRRPPAQAAGRGHAAHLDGLRLQAQADETRLQVLEEEGRSARQLSWIWLRATGHGTPVILFDYSGGQTAARLLEGFAGYLHCDALGSYSAAAGAEVTLLACWAHARRKFDAVIKAVGKGKPPALALQAMAYFLRLYQIDAEVKGQPPDQRHTHRDAQSRPLLAEMRRWLDDHLAAGLGAGGLLATAFIYLHNQWPKLVRFLDDGRLGLDNNPAERPFRPVAVGRKKWLFCHSEDGARATVLWYSVVSTAQANGWEPYHYLRRALSDIPLFLQEGRSLEPLLPWNLAPPPAPA